MLVWQRLVLFNRLFWRIEVRRSLCTIARLRSLPVGHRHMQRVYLRYALRLRREIRAYTLTLEHKQILSAVPH